MFAIKVIIVLGLEFSSFDNTSYCTEKSLKIHSYIRNNVNHNKKQK